MLRAVCFYLGLGLLFTHELDAMPNHEWRVLPVTAWLSDGAGQFVFLVAHVPIFALTIAFVASLNPSIRSVSRLVAAVFLVVHAILHQLFSASADYEFDSTLSSVLIFGAGLCGVVYLFLDMYSRKTTTY